MQRNAKIFCPENHTESSFYEATNPIKVIDSKIKFFIVSYSCRISFPLQTSSIRYDDMNKASLYLNLGPAQDSKTLGLEQGGQKVLND